MTCCSYFPHVVNRVVRLEGGSCWSWWFSWWNQCRFYVTKLARFEITLALFAIRFNGWGLWCGTCRDYNVFGIVEQRQKLSSFGVVWIPSYQEMARFSFAYSLLLCFQRVVVWMEFSLVFLSRADLQMKKNGYSFVCLAMCSSSVSFSTGRFYFLLYRRNWWQPSSNQVFCWGFNFIEEHFRFIWIGKFKLFIGWSLFFMAGLELLFVSYLF